MSLLLGLMAEGEILFFKKLRAFEAHVILLLSTKQLGSSKLLACTPLIGNMKGVRCLKASAFEDVVRASNTGMIRHMMTFVTKSFD